jgi:PAS domain S-box-containing protein
MNLYEIILANLDVGIFAIDEDDRLVFMNKAMETVIDYHKKDIVGLNVLKDTTWLEFSGKVDFYKYILHAKKILHPVHFLELPRVSNKKRIRYFSGTITPLLDMNHTYNGIMCTMEDVTERKEMEDELKKYQLHLEEQVQGRTEDLLDLNKKFKKDLSERALLEKKLMEEKRKLEATLAELTREKHLKN